jgi:hypothetical protein
MRVIGDLDGQITQTAGGFVLRRRVHIVRERRLGFARHIWLGFRSSIFPRNHSNCCICRRLRENAHWVRSYQARVARFSHPQWLCLLQRRKARVAAAMGSLCTADVAEVGTLNGFVLRGRLIRGFVASFVPDAHLSLEQCALSRYTPTPKNPAL